MIYSVSFELGTEVPLGGRDASHSREDVLARFNDHCSDLLDAEGNGAYFGVTEGEIGRASCRERVCHNV